MDKIQLIQEWYELKLKLNQLKDEESVLRQQIVKEIFNSTNEAGTYKIDLEEGYQLKLKNSYSYKVDSEKVVECLEKIAQEDSIVANAVIKWKPELSLREYKMLNNEFKTILDSAITMKLDSPKVELVLPKEE